MSFTSTSTCSSSSSSSSSSSLRIFFNQMLHSLIHPFAPPTKQPATDTNTTTLNRSSPQDLLSLQHDMNANLSLFEKTYVSFPELIDQDTTNTTTTAGRHSPPSSIPC